jgi:hypothetical protein
MLRRSLLIGCCLIMGSARAELLKMGLQGISFHGFQEEPIYYKNMPRRIDDKARLVPNNELYVEYQIPETRTQWVGMMGQDCYQNFATYISWGRAYPLNQYFNYGFIVGAYYRRTRTIYYEGESKNIKEFYTLEVGRGNQFVPMPMITGTFHWSIWDKMGLGVNVGSNIFVTHFVAVLSWQLDAPVKNVVTQR